MNCELSSVKIHYLSLWYLLLMLVKATPMLLINRPAFIVNIAKEYHEVKEAVLNRRIHVSFPVWPIYSEE